MPADDAAEQRRVEVPEIDDVQMHEGAPAPTRHTGSVLFPP